MPKHDESDPLQPKKTTSLGRLVVLSASLSFALGAIAATAVRGSGLRGSDLHETVETSTSATTLIGAWFHVSPPSVDSVGIGRGAAYEIAAGVLELVREFLHALVELFHLREQPSRVTPVSPHCFPYIFFMIIGVGHGVKRYEALLWVIERS